LADELRRQVPSLYSIRMERRSRQPTALLSMAT
jgi:hypothetical protein